MITHWRQNIKIRLETRRLQVSSGGSRGVGVEVEVGERESPPQKKLELILKKFWWKKEILLEEILLEEPF